jgi:hypothetical protein
LNHRGGEPRNGTPTAAANIAKLPPLRKRKE